MPRFHLSIAGFASLLFASVALAQTPSGYWDLNNTSSGTAVDSINGNNGVWQNGVNTNLGQVSGFVGGGANLADAGGAGANNFFQIGSIPQFIGANGLTISAWIDPDAQTNSGYNGIFMTRDFNNLTNNSWGIAIENSGGEHLDSRVDGPGIDSPGGTLSNTTGWKHVALTYDAGTKTHTQFVNGVQTNTASVAGDANLGPTLDAPSGPWFIGYDNCCGNTRDFDGQIDEVAVYSQSLSASEIQQVYSAGLNNVAASQAFTTTAPTGDIQQGLVGSWNMDQVSGTNAAGDSINGNNAVLSGANPITAWVPGQIGRALDLDGTNDQAIISGIPEINGETAMTISMWVRNDGGNEGYEGLFQHRSVGNANQQGLMTPSNQINPNGPNQNNDVMGRLLNNGTIITTPGESIPTGGVYTHVLQRYEGGVLHEILIDGTSVALDAAPPNVPIISDGAWRFGNDVCCGNRFFNGAIDDTGLWNRALSDAEVAAIITAGQDGISHTRAFIPVDEQIQQGTVGHWTFDQARFHPTAADSLGTADAGLSGIDTANSWVQGQIGGALQFDGTNDQAVITGADAASLNAALNGSDALTMSLWINADTLQNNNEGLFEHRSTNLTGFNLPSVGTDNFDFRINSTALRTDDGTLVEDVWQHIVGVWESGERYEIWIDGELVEEGAAPGGTLLADGDWRFGNDACCGDRFYDGAIDDAGLWNRALLGTEIQALYEQGLQQFNVQQAQVVPEPATFALWSLFGAIGAACYWRRRRTRGSAA